MKRKMARTLARLLIPVLLLLPAGVFAESPAGPDAFSLTADNFQVTLAGSPAVDIDLALNLNVGLGPAGDRGLWVMDLSGGGANVLTLIAALEHGQVKGYLRNELGGLPYILQAPMDVLAEMGQMFLPMTPALAPSEDAGQLSGLLASVQALAEASKDAAYLNALRGKVLEALEASFGLTSGGEAEIELFGQTQSAQVSTVQTDFAGLWVALPEIFAADPALHACFTKSVAWMEESSAFGPDAAFADLPKRLYENGNDIQIDITEYAVGEDLLRLELVMTALEKGVEAGTITFTLDSDAGPGHGAVSLGIATDFHGAAEENVWVSLNASHTQRAGSEDGYLGLLVETKGDSGTTAAFQIETQRLDAAAGSATADRALLSVAFISAADPSSYAASILYDAENREENGKPAAEGAIVVEVLQNKASLMKLSFDFLFQRTNLSEGELLSTDGSFAVLDVTQMTAEDDEVLNEALNTLLNNTLGLLFQVPGIAALLSVEVQ